ncbi:DUF1964 domain-containing protein, partial [Bifidobacterium sp. 82T10]
DQHYIATRAVQFFLPGVPQVYYVGALAGVNDMDLLHRTKVGRDINRHYYSTAEVDEQLKRPVVQALNALCRFRNELPAFDGEFAYAADGDRSLTMTWTLAGDDGTVASRAELVFEPARGGVGADVDASIVTLRWTDAAGEHETDDLIANPPVAA